MRFNLIDRIVEVQPGKLLRASKNLTLGEEYLADHFPTFPVMPGVLMLQALVEAGAWLLRLSEDYRHSVIVLREARNVKYDNFMEPGKQMQVAVELSERRAGTATFKGGGTAKAYQADVADVASVEACVKQVEEELGPVDVLVNNAGVIHDDLFVRLEPEHWNKVIQTNLGGTYNFCHALAFSMMRKRSG